MTVGRLSELMFSAIVKGIPTVARCAPGSVITGWVISETSLNSAKIVASSAAVTARVAVRRPSDQRKKHQPFAAVACRVTFLPGRRGPEPATAPPSGGLGSPVTTGTFVKFAVTVISLSLTAKVWAAASGLSKRLAGVHPVKSQPGRGLAFSGTFAPA